MILAFVLLMSSRLHCHQCPCKSDLSDLQDHANRLVMQNIQEIHKQEFGSKASTDTATAPHAKTQLYVFISLSMPMPGLIDLGKQVHHYGGVLVLRGLVEGSYKKTALKLQQFIQQTHTGMIIDPLLFRQYDIKTVPTVVVVSPIAPQFDKVHGFIPIRSALEQMQQQGELKEIATLLQSTPSQETNP